MGLAASGPQSAANRMTAQATKSGQRCMTPRHPDAFTLDSADVRRYVQEQVGARLIQPRKLFSHRTPPHRGVPQSTLWEMPHYLKYCKISSRPTTIVYAFQ